MAKDVLDFLVCNSQAMEVGCWAAAEGVPAVPSGSGRVAIKLVVSSNVVGPCFLALYADRQRSCGLKSTRLKSFGVGIVSSPLSFLPN